MEEVFMEDFLVTVTAAEDEVNSCEELLIIVDLQSITSVSFLIYCNARGARRNISIKSVQRFIII